MKEQRVGDCGRGDCSIPLNRKIARRIALQVLATASGGVILSSVISNSVKKAGDYTVARGDTLSRIAARNGTTVANISRENGIRNPDVIRAGQTIRIPSQAPRAPVAAPKPPVASPRPVAQVPAQRPAPTPKPAPASPRAAFPGTNNNPGNMRYYRIGWHGERPEGIAHGDFTRFDTPQNGLRAMARNLMTLGKRAKQFTIGNVIPVYSPASENNVPRHIKTIVGASGLGRDQVIRSSDDATMVKLLRGVVSAESGKGVAGWYTPQEYLEAVRNARVRM